MPEPAIDHSVSTGAFCRARARSGIRDRAGVTRTRYRGATYGQKFIPLSLLPTSKPPSNVSADFEASRQIQNGDPGFPSFLSSPLSFERRKQQRDTWKDFVFLVLLGIFLKRREGDRRHTEISRRYLQDKYVSRRGRINYEALRACTHEY